MAPRGPGTRRAARGALDRRTGILRLEGGVLAVQGRQVLVAEAAVVDLVSRTADLANATRVLKDRTAPPPSLLRDRAAVRGAGKNALILTGKRIRALSEQARIRRGIRGGLRSARMTAPPLRRDAKGTRQRRTP